MSSSTRRLLNLLILVVLLANEAVYVCGGRRMIVDVSRVSTRMQEMAEKQNRAAEDHHVNSFADMNTEKRRASARSSTSSLEGAEMSKRRVRRGSDPIHNKS